MYLLSFLNHPNGSTTRVLEEIFPVEFLRLNLREGVDSHPIPHNPAFQVPVDGESVRILFEEGPEGRAVVTHVDRTTDF